MSAQPSDCPQPVDRARLLSDTFLASVEHHETVESTNDRAKLLAREGGGDLPTLILADRQTAGRGRGANRWWTGPGSLAFSLLANTDSWNTSQGQMSLSALAAGIALVEAIAIRAADHPLGLHWPNDIYVGERKLAGILVEIPTENRLVVGVGVNTNCRLADAPGELRGRVATLIDLMGEAQDHTSLLVDWLGAWAKWIGRLPSHADQIGDRADELCLQRGRPLRVRQGKQLHEGECLGIASDGALRLMTNEGARPFYSGTIE